MATLSGQTIQSTYQGLLKLADSTSGITNSFQSIEDGLGNDTGMKIKNNFFTQKNQQLLGNLVAEYYGTGIATSAAGPVAGNDNVINISPFYDQGLYQYSAITMSVFTGTSTNDTFEAAIYTSDYSPNVGLYPKDVIISGITASTTSTGLKTFVFPNNISLSATNINFLVFKYTTTAATRTVRFYSASVSPTGAYSQMSMYGFTSNAADTAYGNSYKFGTNAAAGSFSGLTTFNNPYVASDFTTVNNLTNGNVGFVLHTVR